jgi:UDP-glucose 4-epimerase
VEILLTGGTGYIGSHTAIALVEAGHDVVLLDNYSNSKPAVLDRLRMILGEAVPFHQVDVTQESDVDRVLQGGSFDAVIHLAAPKAVQESIERPLHYFENEMAARLRYVVQWSVTVFATSSSPRRRRSTDCPINSS